MRQYNTFSQTESLLLTAIQLPGESIQNISSVTSIKANTLYKWKTTPATYLPKRQTNCSSILWSMNRTVWNSQTQPCNYNNTIYKKVPLLSIVSEM